MASLSAVFSEAERTNWLKAWMAVDIAKSGLEQFVNKEANTLHTNIYNTIRPSSHGAAACIGCHTANLLKCPTQGVCKRSANGNCTSMHDNAAKQQRPCPANVCTKVRDEIVKQHAYKKPSWKNTSAQQWAKHPWEIAKAYFPPDGYVGKTSVQDTDFNGIISFMMNCEQIHNKFSFTIAIGKNSPPCLLTKARDIGRTVRHSPQCKVTDLDLQEIFTTLTSLLSDQTYLAHDVTAQEAVRKLAELEKDTLKITTEEMIHLLEAAQDTLKKVEHIADKALDEMKMHLEQCKKDLNAHTDRCKQKLDEHTAKCTNAIDEHVSKTVDSTYEQSCKELIEGMKKLYNDKLYYVTVSPFDDSSGEKLRDVYMPPKILEMCKEIKTFKKTEKQVNTYKGVFLTDNTVNPRIFIQGEAGSGKTTFLAKLALDWCEGVHGSSASDNSKIIFADFDALQRYEYVFHITLRNSKNQCDVYTMIKEQIIDRIYSAKDREKAYELVSEIMKHQRCLVLLDGLDEWTGPEDLPTLVVVHNKCVMLITTRPWKLAEGKVKHSDIHALLQLEGINKPFELSKIILSRLVDKEELEIKYTAFTLYVKKQKLEELLSSPMMLSAIVCAYADGIELKGSKCEVYILLVESLFKKANSCTRTFQQPPFSFFKRTEYIQPNLEPLNRLAEMAFHLLFVNDKGNSIMFRMTELEKFKIYEYKDFALKSGILSAQRTASALRSSSSFMFIHLSIQEFLAAYQIARNANLIDGSISIYLNRHPEAYLDISQVFIFLCGLDVSCAEKLSSMMDERDALNEFDSDCHKMFNEIILAGLREANANGYSDIALKLSHFYFHNNNIIDLHKIWENNAANAIVLKVNQRISPGNDECASQITFDLHSCMELTHLELSGRCILGKDSASVGTLEFPVCIILNIADPTQCTELPPVLPSIDCIRLTHVTCLCTWLRSLLSMMLTQNCNIKCELNDCHLTACGEGEVNTSYTTGLLCLDVYPNKSISISLTNDTGLWESLHGLSIKSLSLFNGCRVNHEKSFSQTIASLSKLETLDIRMVELTPCVWEALRGLNIKSLTLSSRELGGYHAKSLTQSLSSLKRLETLEIGVDELTPCQFMGCSSCQFMGCSWDALHGLNIKSLTLSSRELGGYHAKSLTQSLSSLKRLETLRIGVTEDSPGLWKALHGLNIKSLSLNGKKRVTWTGDGLRINHSESLSQSLSSLMRLQILDIHVAEDITGLWEAFYGLNIKKLRVFCTCRVKYKESLSHLLPSLIRLETLSIGARKYACPGLWEALKGSSVKSLTIKGENRGFELNHTDLLSQSLSSLTQLETLGMEVWEHSTGLWEAIHTLNIKTLSLTLYGIEWTDLRTESLSKSLSSLTRLETLNVSVYADSSCPWKALHGLNIKSLRLSLFHNGNCKDVQAESLYQSLASLTQLETLSITLHPDSRGLWRGIHCLNIKRLSLKSKEWGGLHKELMSLSLSSLTLLDTLCIEMECDNPGLWEAVHGLNIKNLFLSGLWKRTGIDVTHTVSLSNTLSSLTQLETLSIDVEHESPGLWAALHGQNIKSLSLSGVRKSSGIDVKRAETFSQSLSSLTQLETLTLHVHTYIALQVPQSLKYLNIYSDTMLPSKVRELVDSLAIYTHSIGLKLEFGCASSIDPPERIPVQEYIPFQQELAARKNVAMKRFRIYELPDSAGYAMSVRDIGDVDDAACDILEDDVYKKFAKYIDRYIINRISILIEISPGSIS
ncbi:uncharacterized protein LOC127843703 [Dreissena polymorpha]|uniref:NACHT domain-containing protein n=1 Tax=Dreissena polymorpha TaxID=45954 RepID=A0A9D4IE54_DREPO|nr:uncharacterized protein LOC127843703 [Dreissena polymorpha]KAH3770600.1 hypothetical protein DPMN_171889 [Dreissena polymorpha]